MDAKRGHLAKIDMLPEEAWPFVKEAIKALADRRRTQDDIREELNGHLLGLGCEPVSRGAFNRRAMALSINGEKIRKTREMAAIFAEDPNNMPEGNVGMLIREMSLTLLYDLIESITLEGEPVSPKMIKEIALANLRLEQSGAITSKRAQEISEATKAKVAEVVSVVTKAKGLSAETAEEIKQKILGVAA